MERSIYKFIFRYSTREQVFILLFTVLSLPFYYVSLDVPKLIVNNVLSEPAGETELSVSEIAAGLDLTEPAVRSFSLMGYDLLDMERITLLGVYCGLFLFLVLVNGGFKYYINVYKGLMGERMLRRLRYQLFSRVMRFPLPHFRRVSSGELIPMVTQEVEPLGGFIGDAQRDIRFTATSVRTYDCEYEKLDQLRQFVEDGALTLRVAGTVPPERAPEAHAKLEAGGTRGRMVITF